MAGKIPKKIDKYEIKKQIGVGSMGTVYHGYDQLADRSVAIKVALSDILEDEDSGKRYKEMFFDEANIALKLRHPNIVKTFDAGTDSQGHCYMVMEYVEDAQTLKPFCSLENLLPYRDIVEIIFKCAKALDYIHRNGIIHRDIKPTNILMTKDKDVKIADFSISHFVTSSTDTTKTLQIGFIGSPRYMSPEQAREDIINSQTDLFSLGIIMYEMLTGKHPFPSDSIPKFIYNIAHEDFIPLQRHRNDSPEVLDKIINKILQKKLDKRYQTGGGIAADLSLTFDYLDKPQTELNNQERFNAACKLDFFNEFSESEIWEIVYACTWTQSKKDEEIIVQDDIDDSFYIITSGEVNVYKDKVLIGHLQTGDCFGEMSYISKNKRTATIIADSNVELMKITASMIEQVSIECQLHFTRQFIRTLVKRLSTTTAMYISQSDDSA